MTDLNQEKVDPPNEQPSTSPSTTRRQFVRKLSRSAKYIAPVVVSLAATDSAFASGASGGS